MQPSLPTKRLNFRRLRSQCRRWAIPSLMFLAALPVYAQTGASPWENAVNALKTSFTGPPSHRGCRSWPLSSAA
jgi:type IV secretion system protein TrbC